MNKLFLDEDQIMDYELLTDSSAKNCFYGDIVIYFVLEGEMRLNLGVEEFLLKDRDFILINAFQHHSYQMSDHTLTAGFVINIGELSKYFDLNNVEFRCNSAAGQSEQYVQMRRLLEACIAAYYSKRAKNGRTLIRLNSIYYQIIELLVSGFTLYSVEDSVRPAMASDELRTHEIVSYIQMNYRSAISLDDLAERFYMSTAYISRYIKKHMGKNFGKYLAEVRLDHAVRELETSEKAIVRIALDNGFPNIASFNKIFKEHYEMTPKAYQEQYQKRLKQETADAGKHIVNEMEFRLMDYLEEVKERSVTDENGTDILRTIEVDARQFQYLDKSWNKLINIGCFVNLLRGDVQEHLLFLQEKLGFCYVRMWDLYDEDLKLNILGGDGHHNFSKLDKILDFLVNHKMHPYFELGFKPYILMRGSYRYANYVTRDIAFSDVGEYRQFISLLMVHFVNRYGMQEVSQWYFEQWCDPRLFENGNPGKYFETFEAAYKEIKKVVPEAHVGGNYDREYGSIDFAFLMEAWSRQGIQPDFIGIYCYQNRYIELEFDKSVQMMAEEKLSFIHKYLGDKIETMRACGMNVPLIISEWNMTVVNWNVLNDSCYKGTYVMDTLLKIHDMTEMAGYWLGTDLFVDSDEEPSVLDGSCGLISYHGICKPSFYALDFLNRMGNYLLGKQEEIMVSTNGYDNYMIVCCNHKTLDMQYYMQDEKCLTVERIPVMFQETERMRIHVKINHVRNGFYYVKTRCIGPKHGSVQDEWQHMGLVENLTDQDIEYLRRIATPKITIYEYSVTNNTLNISITMDAHEMQCIHIFRQII